MDKERTTWTGEMSIMDASGHKQLTWALDRPDEIEMAQVTFERLRANGYTAFFSDEKAAPKHVTRTFEPSMKDVVMVPRIVGG